MYPIVLVVIDMLYVFISGYIQVPHVYFIQLLLKKIVTVTFGVNSDRLCLRANHQT